MLNDEFELTIIDCDAYPTKLITKVSPIEVSIEKFPSKSVTTPEFVPCTITEAPGSGIPFSSVTFPENC